MSAYQQRNNSEAGRVEAEAKEFSPAGGVNTAGYMAKVVDAGKLVVAYGVDSGMWAWRKLREASFRVMHPLEEEPVVVGWMDDGGLGYSIVGWVDGWLGLAWLWSRMNWNEVFVEGRGSKIMELWGNWKCFFVYVDFYEVEYRLVFAEYWCDWSLLGAIYCLTRTL